MVAGDFSGRANDARLGKDIRLAYLDGAMSLAPAIGAPDAIRALDDPTFAVPE